MACTHRALVAAGFIALIKAVYIALETVIAMGGRLRLAGMAMPVIREPGKEKMREASMENRPSAAPARKGKR